MSDQPQPVTPQSAPGLPPSRTCRLIFIFVAAVLVVGGLSFIWFPDRPATPAVAPRTPAPVLASIKPPPPPAQPEKDIRPALVEALGFGEKEGPWSRRVAFLRSKPTGLTSVEAEAMITEMMGKLPPNAAPVSHAGYIQELAANLQNVPEVRETFVGALATIARDAQQNLLNRNCALLHLRNAWGGAADNPSLRASIVATLQEFAGSDTDIAPHSLLYLHLLGTDSLKDLPEVTKRAAATPSGGPRPPQPSPAFALPDSEIVPLIEPKLAAKPTKENLSGRLACLRIVGDRRIGRFRQPLMVMLNDSAEDTKVRVAAVTALGKIGNADDFKRLASLHTEDPRVEEAVKYILNTSHVR